MNSKVLAGASKKNPLRNRFMIRAVHQELHLTFIYGVICSKITANPLVRISRMPDPIRDNQSTLPYEPLNRNNDEEDAPVD